MVLKFLLWVTTTMLMCASLIAQNHHLYHFTVDDGLPSSFIYRTFQDSKGYIWICTDMGIARYNGYYFETFTTQQGLPYNDVWDFTEDNYGRIWLHTYCPYFVYYDYADNQIHTLNFCSYGDINVLSFHEWQGDIWASFASRKIINTRTGEEKLLKHFIWGRNGRTSASLLGIDNDLIYDIETKKIIAVLQKNLGEIYEKKTAKNPFDECWNDEQRFIYTTNDTIYYETPTICIAKSLSEINPNIEDHLVRIDIVSDDKLLLVTHKRAYIVNKNLERLTEYDFLQHYDVSSAFEDREGNLWIATKNNGLFMLTQSALKNRLYAMKNKDPKNNLKVQSVVADDRGRIWMATSEGFIYYLENNSIYLLDMGNPFWGHIRQIFLTPKNLLLAVCNDYTLLIDLTQIAIPKKPIAISLPTLSTDAPVTIKKPLPHQFAYFALGMKKIAVGKNNQLLLSGSQLIMQLAEFEEHIQLNTLYNNVRSYALAEDSAQHIFVGTPNGINVLHDQKIETFGDVVAVYPALGSYVSDLLIDKEHNLWVASNGAGLYYLSPQQQKQLLNHDCTTAIYTPIDKIASSVIKSLFLDPQGNIWATSNQGVYCIGIQKDKKQTFHHYSITHGLPTNETFGVYANNQTAYIGTNSGLTQLEINTNAPNNAKKIDLNIYFNEFSVNKKNYFQFINHKIPTFSYKQNNIDIGFVCLSYQSIKQINYYYRIIKGNNVNTPWQSTNAIRREFSSLSPANYCFEVKAKDINGTESSIIKCSFVIAPPWWEQTWFRALVMCILGALLWVTYKIRIRYIRNQEQARNEFAAMRLQVLQSQMNPHFMNNTLNAIQLFIARADSFSANEYLAKFAVLNRLYLEATRRRFIPLAEELQLLETYLELEHLRFPNRFEYRIDVDPKTISDILLFPAMLLQPLAENAINHGILYLQKRNGYLQIVIRKQENKVICLIEDNGIGREAAADIKSKLKKTHISRGMQIIEELQKNINMLNMMSIKIDITDKTDNLGNAEGTLIKITLQYANEK